MSSVTVTRTSVGLVVVALSCGAPPQEFIADADTQSATVGGSSESEDSSEAGSSDGTSSDGTSSDGTSDDWTDETGEPVLCSEDLVLAGYVYATNGDTISITNGVCGYGCDCGRDLPCTWRASGVPQAPGVYPLDEVDAECVWCNNFEADNTSGPDTTGMLEIVRVDENGVQGCVIDSPCVGSFRFIAPWCGE